MHEPDNLAPYF